jgi:hypothetical protein
MVLSMRVVERRATRHAALEVREKGHLVNS